MREETTGIDDVRLRRILDRSASLSNNRHIKEWFQNDENGTWRKTIDLILPTVTRILQEKAAGQDVTKDVDEYIAVRICLEATKIMINVLSDSPSPASLGSA